jgi:integrase
LSRLAEGRAATEWLFKDTTKDALLYWTRKLCRDAGVPEVTPHGLRGTNATASMTANRNPHEVAAALGHASIHGTLRHYADRHQVAAARQHAAVSALGRQLPSKSLSKTFGGPETTEAVIDGLSSEQQ